MKKSNYYNIYKNLNLIVENVKFTLYMSCSFEMEPFVCCNNGQKTSIKHSHLYYEMFYLNRGVLKFVFEDSTIWLKEGDCLIIAPNVTHSSFSKDASVSQYVIAFDFLENKAGPKSDLYNELKKFFSMRDYFLVTDNQKLSEIVSGLCNYYFGTSSEKQHLIAAKFYEMIFFVKSLFDTQNGLTAHKDIDYEDYRCYVIDEILSNQFDNPDFSLQSLADNVLLSTAQINRIIKKKTGKTFKQYVIQFRMENATRLLRETTQNVSDISQNVGYKSLHGFYTIFKRIYGMTPHEYREKIRSIAECPHCS